MPFYPYLFPYLTPAWARYTFNARGYRHYFPTPFGFGPTDVLPAWHGPRPVIFLLRGRTIIP